MPTFSIDENMSPLSLQGGFLVVVAAGLVSGQYMPCIIISRSDPDRC